MLRFSASLSFLFGEVPVLERFSAAASRGFRAVEMMFPYEFPPDEVRDRLTASGQVLELFNLPAGDFAAGERGLASLPERRSEFRRGVDVARRYADVVGTSKLNCLVGLRDDAVSWTQQYDCLVDNLRWAADEIGSDGHLVHVEHVNSMDAPGYFLDSMPLAERLLDDVGSPSLRIMFDAYHVQRSQGDVVMTFRRMVDRVGHVQIADSPGRGEPGSGELNFDYLLAEFERAGFEGCIGLEYRPTGTTDESLGWLRAQGWNGDT